MRYLSLLFFIHSSLLLSQVSYSKLAEEFKKAKDDSVFIVANSTLPFQVFQSDKTQPYDTNDILIKELFKANVGDVIGPFKKGKTINFFKIKGFENAYQVHAGIIWIQYKEGRTEDEMAELAKHIFSEIKSGKDFNTFCRLYSDDNNQTKDCDLGWLFNTKIPMPLSEELSKHKKGDLFISHTKYGYHIVKMLDSPVLEKAKVQFVKMTLKTQ